jgi:hypothetical protein
MAKRARIAELAQGVSVAEGPGFLTDSAKAMGLYHAMYLLPCLGILLVVVLFAASRTVGKDHDRMQKWMATAGGAE